MSFTGLGIPSAVTQPNMFAVFKTAYLIIPVGLEKQEETNENRVPQLPAVMQVMKIKSFISDPGVYWHVCGRLTC